MALFKILRGNASNLPTPQHDGWAYFTTDTHEFFIDYKDKDGVIQRAAITSAKSIPRLSDDGVYYFDSLTTPIQTTLILNCGDAKDFIADIIYNAGDSTTSDYETILEHV